MNKESVVKLSPNVLKRPEESLNRFYLLNFNNDEIWVGNMASFFIISKIDGIKSIENIVSEAMQDFDNCSAEDLYNTSIDIINELAEKDYLTLVK